MPYITSNSIEILNKVFKVSGAAELTDSSPVSSNVFIIPNVADVLLKFVLVDRQASSNSFRLNLFTFAYQFFISWCRLQSISSWMGQTLENLPRQSPAGSAGCVAVRTEQLQDFHQKVVRYSCPSTRK